MSTLSISSRVGTEVVITGFSKFYAFRVVLEKVHAHLYNVCTQYARIHTQLCMFVSRTRTGAGCMVTPIESLVFVCMYTVADYII